MAKIYSPKVMDMEPGEYKWCSCGASKTQPFCDHSHRELANGKKSVRVTIDTKKRVAWCMCKHTKTPPFCDGSHARVNSGFIETDSDDE